MHGCLAARGTLAEAGREGLAAHRRLERPSAACIAVPSLAGDNQTMTIAIQTLILAALASSWNILGGFTGLIGLGHAAFFGLGAIVTRELWLAGAAAATGASSRP